MDFDAEMRPVGTPFKVDQILDLLDDKRADRLRTELMAHKYSNGVIASTITNQTDYSVSESAVRSWRTKYRK